MSVPDANYDSEDILTVVFCIPNTPDWRQAVTALLSNLTYGRAYDDRTTNIKLAQEIGRKIFNSMQMCNLEVYLERIATALDGGAQRYSISDIIAALEEIDTGLDILDYIDVLNFFKELISHFPSLDFKLSPLDVVKFAAGWRITSTQLNYAEDIALSLRGINVGTGGVPMQAIYENLGDGFNTIAAGFTGGQSAAIQFLMQVVRGKDLGVGQDIIEVIEALGLGSMRAAQYNIANNLDNIFGALDECTCGNNPCTCEPGINGPVTDAEEMAFDPCCPPEGFNEFLDYEEYVCKASNHIVSGYANMFNVMYHLPNQFLDNLHAIYDRRQPIFETEVYRRIGLYLAQAVDAQMLAQVTNENRNALLTVLTKHYMDFQVECLNNEVDGPQYIPQRSDFFWEIFEPMVTYMRTNYDDLVQDLFDATVSSSTFDEVASQLDTVASEATGPYANLGLTVATLGQSKGIANLAYQRNETIGQVIPKYVCQGTICSCQKINIELGTDTGNDIYESEFASGPRVVKVWAYVDDVPPTLPGDVCGPPCKCIVSNLEDWTPFVSSDFFVYGENGTVVYNDNEPWPSDTVGYGFHIRSSTDFSVRLQLVEDC